MDFSNQFIDPLQLPSADDVAFTPLHQRLLTIVLLSVVLSALLFAVVLSAYRYQPFFPPPTEINDLYPYLLLGCAAVTAVICTYQAFAVPIMAYCLREHDLHFVSGLLNRRIVSQPILRIQHVELKRGPLERLFDLATVKVFSAGGASHTFEIPGLKFAQAQKIRQFILRHKDIQLDG